nr:MAG TPA: tail component [Caudoviricetes sp.]
MPVSFNEIPQTRVPGVYVEIDNSGALKNLPGKASVGLIIGQKTTGSATALSPRLVTASDNPALLFGAGSECARMVKAWRETNTFNTLYVLPVTASSGTAAVYTLTATVAQSPSAGTVCLYIGGQRITVDVTPATTAATLHTAIAAKISASPDLPVTAQSGDDGVVITAKAKGEVGNNIDISLNYYTGEDLPQGVTVSIEKTTSGSGNPDLSDAIAAMGDTVFTDIVCPYTDAANTALLKTEMARRFNAMERIEGTVFSGLSGTLSEIITKAEAANSPHIVYIECCKTPDPPEERAARLAGIVAYQSQIDPARQYRTLALAGSKPSKTPLTREERDLLLRSGVATTKADAGGNVLIERVVTSYRTNASGNEDVSYLDLTTLKTLIYLRYSYVLRFEQKFPRHKLADDGYPVCDGQAVMTPMVGKGEAVALARDWYDAGLIENFAAFKESIVSERDATDTERLNQLLQPDVINNLRVVAGKIQFIL